MWPHHVVLTKIKWPKMKFKTPDSLMSNFENILETDPGNIFRWPPLVNANLFINVVQLVCTINLNYNLTVDSGPDY